MRFKIAVTVVVVGAVIGIAWAGLRSEPAPDLEPSPVELVDASLKQGYWERVKERSVDESPIAPRELREAASKTKRDVDKMSRLVNQRGGKLFDQLDKAIASIDQSLQGERLTFAILQKVIEELTVECDAVIKAHNEFDASAVEYEALLRHAKPFFQHASMQFIEFGEAEPYADLKEQYFLFSETSLAIAQKLEYRADVVHPGIEQLHSSLDYVVHTQQFLKRVESFLEVVPDSSIEADTFLDKLESYVQKFELLKQALRDFHAAMHSEEETVSSDSNKLST